LRETINIFAIRGWRGMENVTLCVDTEDEFETDVRPKRVKFELEENGYQAIASDEEEEDIEEAEEYEGDDVNF